MAGPNQPGDLPPDLPPEYAEAYRRGFERAYAERSGDPGATQQIDQQIDALDSSSPRRPAPVSPPLGTAPPVDRVAPPARRRGAGRNHRGEPEDARRRFGAPVVLAVLALVLILGAYGLGRLFSTQIASTDSTDPATTDGVVVGEDAGKSESPSSAPAKKANRNPAPYDGRVVAADIGGADASCTSDSGIDAAGNTVSYDVDNAFDGDPSTAWRCDGRGTGQRVTIQLPGTTTIGKVGMVPGYAKTDPVDGADRYAENNRITSARWSFDDGTSVTQKLDGSAENRSLQTMRIPKTKTSELVIEIQQTTRGPRNTVAISEVSVGSVS